MKKVIFLPTKQFSTMQSVLLWFFCGLGSFFALLLLSMAWSDWPHPSSYKNSILGGSLLLFFIWFRWQFIGQSTITITEQTISQRQPVLSPHVSWQAIATVNFRESTRMTHEAGAMIRVHRRLAEITTKHNRRVVFVLSTFATADREKIEGWLTQAAQTGEIPPEIKKQLV